MNKSEITPETRCVDDWIEQLNCVDPFYGKPEDLQKLLDTAPNMNLRKWLKRRIEENAVIRKNLLEED